MVTNFGGKLAKFIQCTSILQQIGESQCCFKKIKWWSDYIRKKFGKLPSSKCRDYDVSVFNKV